MIFRSRKARSGADVLDRRTGGNFDFARANEREPIERLFEEFDPGPPFDLVPERGWVSDADGIWAADSPKLMFELLETFERVGLRRLIRGYLGERPALSVNKCTLRRVSPEAGSIWHQDGAF